MQAGVTAQASLLGMPPELLFQIYDWLRLIETAEEQGPKPRGPDAPPLFTWAPNSRALRPYTQAYVYHSPTIKTWSALAKFAAAVPALSGHGTRTLGEAVRRLRLGSGSLSVGVPSPGIEPVLDRMWPELKRVESLSFEEGFGFAFGNLMYAVEDGFRLPQLESLGITVEADRRGYASPYGLAVWRLLLAAAPKLSEIRIVPEWKVRSRRGPESWRDGWDPLPAEHGPPFATAVRSLELELVFAGQMPAVASFINAFEALESLSLKVGTGTQQPRLLELLSLPKLDKLEHQWSGDEDAVPLAELNFTHLTSLRELTLGGRQYLPDFHLSLPPSTCRLILKKYNLVPLAALTQLITPGTRSHHPNLKHLHLDLAFDAEHAARAKEMTDDEIFFLVVEDQVMWWSEEVSEDGLGRFLSAAEAHGGEVSGNCLIALEIEEVMRGWRERREERLQRQWEAEEEDAEGENLEAAVVSDGGQSDPDESEDSDW